MGVTGWEDARDAPGQFIAGGLARDAATPELLHGRAALLL